MSNILARLRFTQSAALDDKAPTLIDRFQDLAAAGLLFVLSAYQLVCTTLKTLLTSPTKVLFDFESIRDEAFGTFWISTQGADPRDGPLKDYIPLVGSARGVILDLGPGDGRQVQFFTNPGIQAIYGAEPCVPLHAELEKNIEAAGLKGKYHVIECGGQRESLRSKLKDIGLLKSEKTGIFDTIVCLKVLCGIPDQEDTVESLYGLLKPGGKLIALEHVKNPWRTRKGSLLARLLQKFFMFVGWKFFMRGCVLDRDTLNVIKRAADKDEGWYVVDVTRIADWGTISWILGEFVKKP